MLNFLTFVDVANPSVQLEPINYFFVVFSAVTFAIGIAIAFVSSASMVNSREKPRWLIALLMGLIVSGTSLAWAFQLDNRQDSLITAQATTVAEWLSTDYGVTVKPELVTRLIEGDEFVVNVNGVRQVVALRENTTKEFELVSKAGEVIEPKNR